jgi:hypothetical protein
VSRPAGAASPEGVPFYFTECLGDFDFIRGHSYHFPLHLRPPAVTKRNKDAKQASLPAVAGLTRASPIANLSPAARAYLATLGITTLEAGTGTAGLIWMHALAIGYSPAYLTQNAAGFRRDWPRIPLPNTEPALLASAALGREIASLLDTDKPVQGITVGAMRPELKSIADVRRTGRGEVSLSVTVGWGHAGKGGATMNGTTPARNAPPLKRVPKP